MYQQLTLTDLGVPEIKSNPAQKQTKKKNKKTVKQDPGKIASHSTMLQTYVDAQGSLIASKVSNDLLEINSNNLLPQYFGMDLWRFNKVLGWSDGEEAFNLAQKAFVKNYSVRQDSVVLIPAYLLKPIKEEKYDTTVTKAHYKFYKSVVSLLQDENKEHPRIVIPKERNTEQPHYVFSKMTAKIKAEVAQNFNSWLINASNVTKVYISDIVVARLVFPEIKFGSSFSDCAYDIYKTKIGSRIVDVMVLPSPVQLESQEEKGYVLISEFFRVAQNQKEIPNIVVDEITTLKDLKTTLGNLERDKLKFMALDLETSGLNPKFFKQSILSCGFSNGIQAWAFLVEHPLYPNEEGLSMLNYLNDFKGVSNFVFQNAKFDLKWLQHFCGHLPTVRINDTLLVDHWLWEGGGSLSAKLKTHSFSMAKQISRYLGYSSHKDMVATYVENAPLRNEVEMPKASDMTLKDVKHWIDIVKDPKRMEPNSGAYIAIPKDELLRYNGLDAWMTWKIFEEQGKRVIKEVGGKSKVPLTITEIQPRQSRAVSEMELNGAPIDYDVILTNIRKAQDVIHDAEAKLNDLINIEAWRKLNKGEFNLTSNPQLLKYLFEHEKIKRSLLWDEQEGKYSTGADYLKNLIVGHPWVKELDRFKKAYKARNTYLIPFILKSHVGVLYFGLSITGTATGRLSSQNPNLQNLPVSFMKKTPEDRIDIKSCIRVPEGYTFADFDYANLEVKILCAKSYCPDENLIKAINEGADIHCLTASRVFGLNYAELFEAKRKDDTEGEVLTEKDKELLGWRQAAKASIFGTIYGIGPHKFADNLIQGPDESKNDVIARAETILNTLKTVAYPRLLQMFDTNDRNLLEKGYAQTILGRRRRFHLTTPRQNWITLQQAGLLGNFSEIEALKMVVGGGREYRQLGNFLVQSTGSDVVQLFIGEFQKQKDPKYEIKFVAQVHDSIIFHYKNLPGAKDYVNSLLEKTAEQYISAKLGEELPVRIGHACQHGRGYHLH